MTPLLAESIYWHFPILLATVSLVYGATRYEQWSNILREAFTWGFRMAIFLVSIGVALWLIPQLPVWVALTVAGIIAALFTFNGARSGPAAEVTTIKKKLA